jgi:4'-phosphopantetheinyl transferase
MVTVLSDAERAQADRFHFDSDRQRYILAHGVLRTILGNYLQTSPEDLRFDLNDFGKPSLAGGTAARHVQFNLSHSGDLVLVAVALDRAIGVDVELIRPELTGEDVARHYFSSREVADLRAVPAELRPYAFFTCWTRKEAYIKATGMGLSLPLDEFSVSLRPGEPARLIWAAGDAGAPQRWSLTALDPGDGYVGALAVDGAVETVEQVRWGP